MSYFAKLRQKTWTFLSRSLLWGAVAIPLGQEGKWENLKYSSIPKNEVVFKEDKIVVKVNKSSSPMIYPLKRPLKVKGIEIKGQTFGLINLKPDQIQGESGADDFVFRLGLVIPGDKTMNWLQRKIAPDWVNRLYKLAPKGSGVDHIYFLNLAQQPEQRGKQRVHPLSDLIKEKNEWVITQTGEFNLSAEFEETKDVAAIWVSIDGDDTGSKYKVEIKDIQLILASQK